MMKLYLTPFLFKDWESKADIIDILEVRTQEVFNKIQFNKSRGQSFLFSRALPSLYKINISVINMIILSFIHFGLINEIK